MTDDVCPRDANRLHEPAERVGFTLERQGTCQWTAARVAGSMVMNEAETAGKRRLIEERREPVGAGAVMDEDDVFAGATSFVFDFDPGESDSMHAKNR